LTPILDRLRWRPHVLAAVWYYATSLWTLFRCTTFWRIPLVLTRRPICIRMRGGPSLYVRTLMDIWIAKEVVIDHQYDVFDGVDDSWTIVDVGAGIGDFAVYMSPRVKMVYSFERDHASCVLAERNLALNACTNVHLVQQVVSDLDALFAEHGIMQCDLLKVDCEGCEYHLFDTVADETLRRIERIVMEVHLPDQRARSKHGQLVARLTRNGLQVREQMNSVHSYLRLLYACR
jgi:precorrin-6B methylase 2